MIMRTSIPIADATNTGTINHKMSSTDSILNLPLNPTKSSIMHITAMTAVRKYSAKNPSPEQSEPILLI